MIDQSHNLKPKIEATIQAVNMAQELWTKAALVDVAKLRKAQAKGDIVECGAGVKGGVFNRRDNDAARVAETA